MTFSVNAQKGLVIDESFEGTFPPTDWAIFEDGTGTTLWDQSDWWPVTGTQCAKAPYDDSGNHNSEWLVTPVITSGANELTFYACDNYDATEYYSTLSVKISTTDQTTTSAFTNLLTIQEADAGHGVMTQYTVDLSAYSGSSVYIAFVMEDFDDDGEDWFIDDVKVSVTESHDLAVTAITPQFVLTGATVTPQVAIQSYSSDEEASYQVDLTDGADYSSTVNITTPIAAGEEVFIDMESWTPADNDYTLTATVTLTGDVNTDNDEMAISCIVGNYNQDTYTSNTGDNIYGTINLENGDFTEIGTVTSDPFPMAEEYNGEYIYRVRNDMSFGIVAPNGTFINKGNLTGYSGIVTGLAWDWTNNIMYVMILTDDTDNYPNLFTLNLETLVLTQIGSTGTVSGIVAIDMANDGYIYGTTVNITGDRLIKIDTETAIVTDIAPLNIDINNGQDISYDAQTNILYSYIWTGYESKLGTFDLLTGNFTEISSGADKQHPTLVITKSGIPSTISEHNSNINIYPNPSNGVLNINVNENYNIEVIDVTGKIINTKTVNFNSQLAINKSGIYFIRFSNENKTFVKKVVIK